MAKRTVESTAHGYADYVMLGVKIPRELRERIKRLAAGKGESVNSWVLKRLAREARWGTGAKK